MSCDCESIKKGYVWNSRENICEDKNECEFRSICPDGKQCVNTDGGYKCICPRGTTENPRTNECEKVVTTTPKVTPKEDQSEDEEIIAQSAFSSDFGDYDSSDDDFNEDLADSEGGNDKSSDTDELSPEDSESEPYQKPDANSASDNSESKNQPEVGKAGSKRNTQQKSGLGKGGTVKNGGVKEETKKFLSGFLGFVSSGTKVAPSWLFTLGTSFPLFQLFRWERILC